ncbi:hypothetical protein KEM56_005656 [Ascosphaera pollenicola]|nr:hypothetical protein KEM56_005656 [Ascosphaera pollenicola]
MAPQTKAKGRSKGKAKSPTPLSTLEGNSYSACPIFDEEFDQSSPVGSTQDSGAMRAALKELQTAMQAGDKRDTFLKDFEKQILAEEKEALSIVHDDAQARQTETSAFRQTFTALLLEAMSPTGNEKSFKEKDMLSASSKTHPLYKRYTSFISACDTLEAMLHEVSTGHNIMNDVDIPPDLEDVFRKDLGETRRVIAVGMKASQLDIESVVATKKKGEKKRKERKQKTQLETDEHVADMLMKGQAVAGLQAKRGDLVGWGETAKRMQKGVKTLAQALPESEVATKQKKR